MWRQRFARDICRLWDSLGFSYRDVAALARENGVLVDRVELWRIRNAETGVSFEKILWVLDALDVEWERKLGVRTVAQVMVKHPHWISGETPIREAIKDLETRGFSQAPVRDSNRRYLGVLVREHAASLLSRGQSPTHPAREFVEDAIKVHLQTGVPKLVQILGQGTPFVLVEWKGEVVGIVSYTDLYARVGESRVRRMTGRRGGESPPRGR